MEFLEVRRLVAAELPGNSEFFVDDSVMPLSPPQPTHKYHPSEEIFSSLSSTSSDPDGEHSYTSNSSSFEDVPHILNLKAPPPPIPTRETVFDVELLVGVQYPE